MSCRDLPSERRDDDPARACLMTGTETETETEGAARLAPRVPGFTCGEPLGQGGAGVVWAARRDEDGAAAAIKVAHGAAPVLVERFRREVDALARVGPPHVARLLRHGRLDDGRPYIAMERLFGRTLAAYLAALRAAVPPAPPHPSRVAERARALLAALAAVHAQGVIHRDFKPGNIFLAGPEEQVVLLDFGLARRARAREEGEAALTSAGMSVGTPEYMAPEQIRGDEAVDERADLYAFGVILFEMLTLRLPFGGEGVAVEQAHLALRPPRPSDLAVVPEALEELTLSCLAKEPDRRPRSAAAIRRALAHAVDAVSLAPVSVAPSSVGSAGSAGSAGGPSSGPLVTAGAQPAVILVADASGAATGVTAAVSARNGIVARRRGRRYVAVFSGRDCADPARAALTAARALVEQQGARAALHLAPVTIRPKPQGAPGVYAAAVDRPEAWLPAEPWAGVALTPELEQHLAEQGDTATLREQGSETGSEDEGPLVGRDDVLAALAASASEAFDGTCPALLTLVGDAGLGKSRLAAEAARAARRACEESLVLELRATPSASAAAEAPETREVLRWVLAESGVAPPPGPAGRAGPAGRHTVVQAIARGLRQRARERPVVVIVDDAHWADDALLDALEYATLDGAGVRLWAVVVAHGRFEQQRRAWGARTQRHARVTLGPLEEEAATALAARLLLPAEYPPAEALRSLAAWAGHNPTCLRQLVRSLKQAGAVRPRPNASGFYLATAELEAFAATPGWQWLSARQLDAMPPEFAACARVCAVLGASFTRAELEGVLAAAERARTAGTPVDAGVGLEALAGCKLVRCCKRHGEDRYAFQSVVLQDAIYRTLDPDQRAEIHGHALAFWRSRASAGEAAPAELEALARHAAACGAREEAADAHLRLGDLAFARHRCVEADGRYTAALGAVADDDAARRARALAGRGKVRYRVHRLREAREDLAAALALAVDLDDRRLQAELLLEDATVLDWERDFEGSARRTEEARRLVQELRAPELEVRLCVAEGRVCHRQKRAEEAIARLERAITEAAAIGDEESAVIAGLLLAPQLAQCGRLEEAEARFEEVIARTTAAGDWLHLSAAYGNRVVLWIARRSPGQALDDLRRAAEIAREVGNPMLEHVAAYNVAVMLYRRDEQREALAYARRARSLGERLVERPIAASPLLLAEVLLILEAYEEASSLVARIPGPPTPDDLPCYAMLRLVLSERGGHGIEPPALGWGEVIGLAQERRLATESVLRLLYWRARMALSGGRLEEADQALGAARATRGDSPMWAPRFEALESRLADISARSDSHGRSA